MSTTVAARIDRLINDESKTKAYATLTINDTFAIHGVRLIQGKNGLFASMPSIFDSFFTTSSSKIYSSTCLRA